MTEAAGPAGAESHFATWRTTCWLPGCSCSIAWIYLGEADEDMLLLRALICPCFPLAAWHQQL